jgi:uncharacterized protein (TIGR03118 family)
MARQLRCAMRAAVALAAAVALVSLTAPTSIAAGSRVAKASGSWAAVASMPTARFYQTATLLTNGEVLVAGGVDANGASLSSAELYDPATRSWKATGSLHEARFAAGATRLADGRVLVAGGDPFFFQATQALSSAEIYDPSTGAWSLTGSMSQGRSLAATVLLDNGQVLTVGGWPDRADSFALNSAELYNPATGMWTTTGSMAFGRVVDQQAVVLSDGDVLVAGGLICCPYQSLATTELYHRATGTWTTARSMAVPRATASLVKLSDGNVLIAGGASGGTVTTTAEVFDPITVTWSPTSAMNVAREGSAMTLLMNGNALVAGGADDSGTILNSSEVYNPGTAQWALTSPMPAATLFPTATRLADGTVLLAGGTSSTTLLPALAQAEVFTPAATGGYRQINLVSDIPGVARVTDPNLINPWGMSELPGSPLWVSDNNAKVATLYTGDQGGGPLTPAPLVVKIDGASPTGQVANTTNKFVVRRGGASAPALFIFASENGDITGWAPTVPTPPAGGISTEAVIAQRNPGAVYKGLAIETTGLVPLLYAADFSTGAIDVFDEEFQPVAHPGRFVDPAVPQGYAPFNIANLGGELYVSYAKQDALKHDDMTGPGHGFIDVYGLDGTLSRRLIQRGDLNSPWGMVLATSHFGQFSNDLLVGNFGDGKIHAYDPTTGAELGALTNSDGNQIQIDGLWGLLYGDKSAGTANTLFFSAGIARESHGLLGSLTAQP